MIEKHGKQFASMAELRRFEAARPSDALQPCPFCGHAEGLRMASSNEDLDPDDEHRHPEFWGVVCDASTDRDLGGCGASAGYRPTMEEAAALWNSRASQSESAPQPEIQYITGQKVAAIFDPTRHYCTSPEPRPSEKHSEGQLGWVWPDMVEWLRNGEGIGVVNLHRTQEHPDMVPVFLQSAIPQSEWNNALDRALLRCEEEQANYSGPGSVSRAVHGGLQQAMFRIRALKRPLDGTRAKEER